MGQPPCDITMDDVFKAWIEYIKENPDAFKNAGRALANAKDAEIIKKILEDPNKILLGAGVTIDEEEE